MYKLYRSPRKDKKYAVVLPDGTAVHFGARGMSDYTIHKDKDRRNNYIARHGADADQNWEDPTTAGFWSRWLLWNKPTLESSLRDIRKKFNIGVSIGD